MRERENRENQIVRKPRESEKAKPERIRLREIRENQKERKREREITDHRRVKAGKRESDKENERKRG